MVDVAGFILDVCFVQVILKNLPPSSSLINEIMENVKGFLASKALLKGEPSTSQSLRYIRGERVSAFSLILLDILHLNRAVLPAFLIYPGTV